MNLPASVQEIADVIGRERALYLVGQLPRSYQTRKHSRQASWHVIMYVPKSLKPDHPLVRILGWHDANKLAVVFGGEILQPANCADIWRGFRDRMARRMEAAGLPWPEIADTLGVSERHLRNMLREKAQEAKKEAANDS